MIDHSYPVPSRIAEHRTNYHNPQQINGEKYNYGDKREKINHVHMNRFIIIYILQISRRHGQNEDVIRSLEIKLV